MGIETLKPCPFCGAALKPFISTREVTTADGRKIGEIKHGYWVHPDDSKCPLGFGFSLALEELIAGTIEKKIACAGVRPKRNHLWKKTGTSMVMFLFWMPALKDLLQTRDGLM